jgi:hypothetical protein
LTIRVLKERIVPLTIPSSHPDRPHMSSVGHVADGTRLHMIE